MDEHETDTRTATDRAGAAPALRNILRTAWRLGLGAIAVGYVVLVPLTALLIGVRVLGGTTVGESAFVVSGLVVVTIAYWGLVWWIEDRGLARWGASSRASPDAVRPVDPGWDD